RFNFCRAARKQFRRSICTIARSNLSHGSDNFPGQGSVRRKITAGDLEPRRLSAPQKRAIGKIYSRQLAISVSKIAEAPIASSFSMILITSPRGTSTFTAHQVASSKALTVGELNPGVIFSPSGNLARGTLYSSSE